MIQRLENVKPLIIRGMYIISRSSSTTKALYHTYIKLNSADHSFKNYNISFGFENQFYVRLEKPRGTNFRRSNTLAWKT
jgi:hypothetical protein